MKLKFKISNLNEVSEELRPLYVQQQDGSFLLAVDGAVETSKLDEFRTNNVTLKQNAEQLQAQLEQLTTKFGDLDPEKAKEALSIVNQLRDQKLIEEGKIEELIEARTKDMLTNHKTREGELTGAIDEWKGKFESLNGDYTKLRIGSEIIGALSKIGKVHPTAHDILTNMALDTWKLNDKKELVAMKGDQPLYSSEDATKPLTPEEWGLGVAGTHGYLFETTTGVPGHTGGQGGGGQVHGYISGEDNAAFEDNIEAIAAGSVVVR